VKQKLFIFPLLLVLVANPFLFTACRSGKEYAAITDAELVAYVETLSDQQKRNLAQNQNQRKAMLDQLKKMFSLAQAALTEGLDKGEDYTKKMIFDQTRMLAMLHSKKSESTQIAKTDIDAYVAAHQKEFDADMAYANKDNPQAPDAAQLETFKAQWGEMQVRAEKARQAGIDKEPATLFIMKVQRGNLLANLYSQKIEDQFKITDAQKQEFIKKNPELDPEKVKEKVVAFAQRLKQGESFEKIADEVNEDGSKGQGGDLGWFGKGAMDPDFEKAAFALQAGQVTQEPVKTGFGYHLIKVAERRKAAAKPTVPPGTVANTISQVAGGDPNAEEIHAKHIYLSTQVVTESLSQLSQEKIKRAMEDATLKYPVVAPADFAVKVEGLRDANSRRPALGSGEASSMRQIDPNANR
jgi:hypothetical protein